MENRLSILIFFYAVSFKSHAVNEEMSIPSLATLLKQYCLPMRISFSVTTSDQQIESFMRNTGYTDILHNRMIENLRKKISADCYKLFYIFYEQAIDYAIDNVIMLEWLDLAKVDYIDSNIIEAMSISHQKCELACRSALDN